MKQITEMSLTLDENRLLERLRIIDREVHDLRYKMDRDKQEFIFKVKLKAQILEDIRRKINEQKIED